MKFLMLMFCLVFALGAYAAVEIYDDSGPPVEDTFIVDSNDFEMNVEITADGVEVFAMEPVESMQYFLWPYGTMEYDIDLLFEITPNQLTANEPEQTYEDVFNEQRGKFDNYCKLYPRI